MGGVVFGGMAQRLMFLPQNLPSVSARDVAEKRQRGDDFVLLDVREPLELQQVQLGEGVALAPMSRLAREGIGAFEPPYSS